MLMTLGPVPLPSISDLKMTQPQAKVLLLRTMGCQVGQTSHLAETGRQKPPGVPCKGCRWLLLNCYL